MKTKIKRIQQFIIPIVLLFFACDDILEEDISNDVVSIITPTAGQTIEGNTTAFNWQVLDGADEYQLQVLADNLAIIEDSIVTTNSLNLNLMPGQYQWRIKAQNFAYETQYTFPIQFSVVVSEDLTNQNVILETPTDNFYTNASSVIVNWTPIPSATSYDIEVLRVNAGQIIIHQEQDVANTSVTLQASLFTEDAEYLWRVKAKNNTSQTLFSEHSFFIDRITPNIPSLNTPADASTSSMAVTFNWSNGSDSGNIQSTINNTIEIATDTNFNAIIETHTTQSNTYDYTFLSTGNYYWRVKAVDLAGNTSEYSIVRTLVIQ